jgi:hypothetical protein
MTDERYSRNTALFAPQAKTGSPPPVPSSPALADLAVTLDSSSHTSA